MSWVVLIASGVLESVWAIALSESRGFSWLGPSLVFVVALIASMLGLAYALRTIPVGTGYAVWVGVGAVGTAIVGMLALHEPASTIKVLCLLMIVGGIVGLKLAS